MWSFFEEDCSLEYPLTFCESKITLGNLGVVMHSVSPECFDFRPLLLSALPADNLRSALGRTMHMEVCSLQSCVGSYGEPFLSKKLARVWKLLFDDGEKTGDRFLMTRWRSFRLIPKRQTHLCCCCRVAEVLGVGFSTSQCWTQRKETSKGSGTTKANLRKLSGLKAKTKSPNEKSAIWKASAPASIYCREYLRMVSSEDHNNCEGAVMDKQRHRRYTINRSIV
jgi:hypothetical protein